MGPINMCLGGGTAVWPLPSPTHAVYEWSGKIHSSVFYCCDIIWGKKEKRGEGASVYCCKGKLSQDLKAKTNYDK